MFDPFSKLAACLKALSRDPSIVVLKCDVDKQRFDENYDAMAHAAGYRYQASIYPPTIRPRPSTDPRFSPLRVLPTFNLGTCK